MTVRNRQLVSKIRAFTSFVVTYGAVRSLPPAGPHGDRATGVAVLSSSGTFPVEVHGLALKGLTESAGDVENLAGTGGGGTSSWKR